MQRRAWIMGSLVSLALTIAAPIVAYAAAYHYGITVGPFNWKFYTDNNYTYWGYANLYSFQDTSGDNVHLYGTQAGVTEQADVFYWIDSTLSPIEVIGNYDSTHNFGINWWYTDRNGTYYVGCYNGWQTYPQDQDPFYGSVTLQYDCLGYY